MKLSFSLPSKPSSKSKLTTTTTDRREESSKEFLTEFTTATATGPAQNGDHRETLGPPRPKYVIPPKENEWRPHKKMKNLELPLRSDDPDAVGFELELPSVAADDNNISYGLNLRQSVKDPENGNDDGRSERLRSAPTEHVLLQSFKEDMKKLPDDRGFEEFEEVPVEGFGAALLAGYGWYEGRGIGKNAKEDVKVKQYERRAGKEGLGFVAEKLPRVDSKKKEKEKESRHVRVISGAHMGLKGKIIERSNANWVVVKLSKYDEEVKVHHADVADVGSKEEEKWLKSWKEMKELENLRQSKIREEKAPNRKEKEKGVSKGSSQNEKKSGYCDAQGRHDHSKSDRERIPWLRSHIRVRIISRDFRGGRLYLKKGEVVDVVGPTKCDISLDETGAGLILICHSLLSS
ncbi:protein MOS2-like [Carica papaya]|uniref:protein MOS2-like n=1 Tax=Carica papaya TaxID=3649 RepID=UPI000B8CCCDB|nr:protein MOS2-like [Carica papaya]